MRPSDGRFHLWPAAVIGFLVVLAAIGLKSAVRLNNSPPSDFIAVRVPGEAGANAATAGAYWETAVRVIQWKYTRVAGLPEQVPEDFRLPDGAGQTNSTAGRAAYWQKLREEWLKSENWHTTYAFDLRWLLTDIISLSHAVGDFVDRI